MRADSIGFLGRIVALAAVAAILLPAQLKPAAKPNIIFIMADDMGYADAGAYGGKLIQTPNIDKLAREGMRFTQAYSGHPVCAPSRDVLMTGMHTGHTTIRNNFAVTGGVTGIGGGAHRIPLRAADVTVAEVLKKAGYATGITGKWGLGEPNTTGLPNDHGFDEWFGFLNQRRAHTYYPTFLWAQREKFDLPGNTGDEKTQYVHDLFTGFALNFIRRHSHEPFFLYLPYTTPHGDWEIPSVKPYENQPWTEEEKVYAAMITRMDRHIGLILQLLEERKLAANTIVFFCSDNGAANRYDGVFNSTGVFREKKGSVYEGGIRVPFIVRWTGHVPAGRTDDVSPIYFADFLPTAAAAAGVKPPPHLDGLNILPLLLGKPEDTGNRFLYWESHAHGFHQAARWKNWKAVRHSDKPAIELYNLATDPGESKDVANEHRRIVAGFREVFDRDRTNSPYYPVTIKVHPKPRTLLNSFPGGEK